LQFLPNTKCFTKKGFTEGTFWGIPFAEIEEPDVRSQSLSELMDITEHEYDSILTSLDEDLLPEAYFELKNSIGRCIGQADLAWPLYRCAIVDEADNKPWLEAGWHTLLPSTDSITIIETLKEHR
jgi:hypothetical protein